jgi:hypothetical protein
MGRQHIRDGVLHIRQQKTGTELAIPIHPELQQVLDETLSSPCSRRPAERPNNNDMTNIRKHELVSQLFLSLDCAAAIRNFDGRNFAVHACCPNRTAAMRIVSRTSETRRRVPRTHFLRYERAQRLLPRERLANSQTACGISARSAHNRGSRKRRRSR